MAASPCLAPSQPMAEPSSLWESLLLWPQANNPGLKLQPGGIRVHHVIGKTSIPLSSLGNWFSPENSPQTSPRGVPSHTKFFYFQRGFFFPMKARTDCLDTKMLVLEGFLVTWHTLIFELWPSRHICNCRAGNYGCVCVTKVFPQGFPLLSFLSQAIRGPTILITATHTCKS